MAHIAQYAYEKSPTITCRAYSEHYRGFSKGNDTRFLIY